MTVPKMTNHHMSVLRKPFKYEEMTMNPKRQQVTKRDSYVYQRVKREVLLQTRDQDYVQSSDQHPYVFTQILYVSEILLHKKSHAATIEYVPHMDKFKRLRGCADDGQSFSCRITDPYSMRVTHRWMGRQPNSYNRTLSTFVQKKGGNLQNCHSWQTGNL